MEFIEKPTSQKARELIKDKSFTWNSGIFLFNALTMIKEMTSYCPKLLDYCGESLNNSEIDLDFNRLNEESFKNCPIFL